MKWYLLHLILFLIFSILGCSNDHYEIKNLNNNKIFVLGHAGMGEAFQFPSNTWESIEPLFEIGAMGSEIDVQMTKDQQIVLYHDKDLSENTALKGKIHSKNLDELINCLLVSPISSKVKILSLESLFQKTQHIKPFFSLDVKLYPDESSNYIENFAIAIKKLVEKYQLEHTVMVECANLEFLNKLKQICPKIKLFILSRNFEQGFHDSVQNQLYGISTDFKNINMNQINFAHENQKRIMLWNVRSISDQKDAIQLNPDFIQSDKPISLLKELKMYKK